MNKKFTLLSLIASPILIGGGFAALTLVNQCSSSKPASLWYNIALAFENDILTGIDDDYADETIQNTAYDMASGNFKERFSKVDFCKNTEVKWKSTTLQNCLLKAKDNSSLLSGYIPLTWDQNGFNTDGTNWVGYSSGALTINDSGLINGVTNSYVADNLVIPNAVNGTIENSLSSATLTGTTYIGNNMTNIGGYGFATTGSDIVFPNSINPISVKESAIDTLGSVDAPVSVTITPSVNFTGSYAFNGSCLSSLTFVGFSSLPSYSQGTGTFNSISKSNAGTISSINSNISSEEMLKCLQNNFGLPSNWTAI